LAGMWHLPEECTHHYTSLNYDWRSVFLFLELKAYLRVRFRVMVRVRARVRVKLRAR